MKKEKAVFKFNGGLGAILCSNCYVIIKTGKDFSSSEKSGMHGKKYIKPQYCEKCQNKKI
jgi:NAD-dependent SIR2 family protein deacetylase